MEDEPESPGSGEGAEKPRVDASDRRRAVYALSVAAELLESAERKRSESSFDEAISLARDSMRVSSSAVLFLDGKTASDLESSCAFLKGRYGDILPLQEWRDVETLAKADFADRLAGLFGAGRQQMEKNATRALEAAARFFGATSAIVSEAAGEEAGEQAGESGEEPGSGGAVLEFLPQPSEEEVYGEAS